MGAVRLPGSGFRRKLSEREWTILLSVVVLLVTGLSYFRHSVRWGSDPSPHIDGAKLSLEMIPLVNGDEPTALLFTRAGCVVCHTIPGIPAAEGRVGPKLTLAVNGPKRLADPNYRGEAKTVHDYIYESILTPGKYVVPGYPDQVMPRWYGQKLSAGALEKISAYLESLSD